MQLLKGLLQPFDLHPLPNGSSFVLSLEFTLSFLMFLFSLYYTRTLQGARHPAWGSGGSTLNACLAL